VAKVGRLLDEAERIAAGPREWWLEGLAAMCRSHDGEPPLGAACVHHGPYGTRSTTLLAQGADRGESRLLFAEGPPCRTELRDRSSFLQELFRNGTATAGAQAGSLR
jgi:hypothetical protein